jgi:hypothetical protein
MCFGLVHWLWQRPEVSFSGFFLLWQLLQASLDEGRTLAEFEP